MTSVESPSERTPTPTPKSRFRRYYRIVSGTLAALAFAYLLLLNFPQVLFAHSTEYGRYKVYSANEPGPELNQVLDKADERLKRSPLYDESFTRRVYLTGSFGMYAFLSNKAYGSFGNSVPFINNIMINKSDVATDRIYIPREQNNSGSLSGVIAHEVTHLLIRQRYGTIKAWALSTWKNEGYCEYIAGDSTIPLEEGIRLWRENPNDDSRYRYTKYHLMVKYLLESEHLSVDELFAGTFDEKQTAEKAYQWFANKTAG